jgi:hypothetical protein
LVVKVLQLLNLAFSKGESFKPVMLFDIQWDKPKLLRVSGHVKRTAEDFFTSSGGQFI